MHTIITSPPLRWLNGLTFALAISLCFFEFGILTPDRAMFQFESEVAYDDEVMWPVRIDLPKPPPLLNASLPPAPSPSIQTLTLSTAAEDIPFLENRIEDMAPEVSYLPIPDTSTFTFMDKDPAFPGGESELYQFLRSNVRYPPCALADDISGTVNVQFVVNEKGFIDAHSIVILRSPSECLSKEAKRVILNMPQWEPGVYNGKAVRGYFKLPFTFRMIR